MGCALAHYPNVSGSLRYRYLVESATPHPLGVQDMYIDPTTGSLVLQFLAAGILSVLAMASRVREAVKNFFKHLVPRRGRWAGKP
jgi:hypothetical protein